MLIVSGWIAVDPEAREGYLAGCRRVVEEARATPGCLDFVLSADPLEADRITVYERWASDAELAGFRGSGPEPEQTAEIRDAQVHKYRISAIEPP
ncbi:putative quinol monooxygenase [Streptomyces albipurpureus]|uniref:Antibiotic biosynthesis monooxygenase n=1 Tax=Streptomyces albipurpureus TaxID=2897419 RepID=A0ABT0UR79_9ACTN|nr:antibiotic biosynthesis monooxygenase family protein [Streptomyces sp. CWNU-1]MCM2391053.1 antibiotic biosynthesis monooxygenase [Streptomyces sp. CWNU-1]